MKRVRAVVLTLAVTMATAIASGQSSYVTEVSLNSNVAGLGQTAEIDWTTGTVRVRGAGTARAGLTLAQATLQARGAARADAVRLVAMAINEVRVTADSQVQDYVLESDAVRVQLDALLRGVTFPEDRETIEKLADGSFIFYSVAEISMYGRQQPSLANVVYPHARELESEAIEPVASQPAGPVAMEGDGQPPTPKDNALPEESPPESDEQEAQAPYTGLIIDATAFSIDATMAPRVYSDTGEVIYGLLSTTTEYANDIGVVSYHHSLESARADSRVGAHPLVVRAVDVIGRNIFSEHPVISASDAQWVLQADAEGQFLPNAAVAIVGK